MVYKDNAEGKVSIGDFKFPELTKGASLSSKKTFELKEIKHSKINQKELQLEIRSEREHAKKNDFSFAPFVQEHRGIKKQEEEDYQQRLAQEIERNVAQLRDEAFQKGHKEGLELGKNEIYAELKQKVDEELKKFTAMLDDVRKTKDTVIKNEILEIYELIKTLTKWVILRELKEDGDYVKRLLEKLVIELQTRSNILIKVNLDWFKSMPEVLSQVEKTFGGLPNTRVEYNHDLGQYGMMAESENSLVDGTIEAQLENLNKLFDLVMVKET